MTAVTRWVKTLRCVPIDGRIVVQAHKVLPVDIVRLIHVFFSLQILLRCSLSRRAACPQYVRCNSDVSR